LWVAGTIVIQGIVRPRRLTRVRLLDGWTIVNIVVQVGCMTLLAFLAGGGPFTYLVASTVFAIGLHPLGARWIQEHFALAPGQAVCPTTALSTGSRSTSGNTTSISRIW
jgi:sphingolipid delta-4 desaturase